MKTPKKSISISSIIIFYIGLTFPAGLLEDWVMGEMFGQTESRGWSFLLLWISPLVGAVALFGIFVAVRSLFVGYKGRIESDYQPGSSRMVVSVKAHPPSVVIGKAGGPKFELNTNNGKERRLEAEVPIQSLRFTKPKDIVIRPDHPLPVVIECENSTWRRLRDKLLFIRRPRIIVKGFTEKGIIWDEENTTGLDIAIEFYPKQLVR